MTTPNPIFFPLGAELPVANDALHQHLRDVMPTADIKYVDPKEMVVRVLGAYSMISLVRGATHPASLPEGTFSVTPAIGSAAGEITSESDLKVADETGALVDVTPALFAEALIRAAWPLVAATTAEAKAGVSTIKFVTPATLKAAYDYWEATPPFTGTQELI